MKNLEHLGSLIQGLSTSKYISQFGETERVVQGRNLDRYYVSPPIDIFNLDAPNPDRYRLCINDVVLSIKGSVKKASVVDSKSEGAIVGGNLALFRPSIEKINPLYLAVVLRSDLMDASLSEIYGQSTGTQAVSLKQLKKLKIPVPALERQYEIAELFLQVEEFDIASRQAADARKRLANLSLPKLVS